MRSIQVLAPAAGSLALLLAAGCTTVTQRDTRVTAPVAAPTPARAATAETPQPTAIEAALARGAESNSSIPLQSADTPAGDAGGGPVLSPGAPRQYTVKRGDTLWAIAAMFLRDPWLWPEIWHVNPRIANPHLIYPGDSLTLAYGADGRPELQLTRAGAGTGQLQGSTRVDPLVRSAPLETAIPTIPSAALNGFIGRPLLVSPELQRRAPHVVALQDRHAAVGAPHEVFVTGLAAGAAGRYTVVRVGETLRDPVTHKPLGFLGLNTGTARVETTAKVSRATLLDSARETEPGDLLIPEESSTLGDIVPRVPSARLDGQIIAVVDGLTMVGQYQVVAINRGARQGLQPGHVLAIFSPGESVHDKSCERRGDSFCFGGGPRVQLPERRGGTVLVFKTYQDVSFGLTVSVTAPIRVEDHVRSP